MIKQTTLLLFVILFANGCSNDLSESPMPNGDPSNSAGRDLRGYKYHPYAMLNGAGKFLWSQQALKGYRRVNESDLPDNILTLKQSCNFPVPHEQDNVHHIHIGQSIQESPVYAISTRNIGKRADRFINSYMATNGKPVGSFIGNDAMGVVNVVVTETASPIYLVLTSQSQTIWNIHQAENVQITNIALIGPGAVGIANAPLEATITAIGGYQLSTCNVKPARTPEKHWRFVQNAAKSNSAQNVLAKNRAAGKAYRNWFFQTFKRQARENFSQAFGASNVLVGPPPQEPEFRVGFTPLKKSTVAITKEDYLFSASKRDYRKQNRQLVKATATQAAGGDLSLLLPGATQ